MRFILVTGVTHIKTNIYTHFECLLFIFFCLQLFGYQKYGQILRLFDLNKGIDVTNI